MFGWNKKPEVIVKQDVSLSESERISIWMQGFNAGMLKSWDLLLPVMVGNIEALKKKIYEDATFDSITRLNGKKK